MSEPCIRDIAGRSQKVVNSVDGVNVAASSLSMGEAGAKVWWPVKRRSWLVAKAPRPEIGSRGGEFVARGWCFCTGSPCLRTLGLMCGGWRSGGISGCIPCPKQISLIGSSVTTTAISR